MNHAELLAAIDADLKLAEEATPGPWTFDGREIEAQIDPRINPWGSPHPEWSHTVAIANGALWSGDAGATGRQAVIQKANGSFIARYRSIGPGWGKIHRETVKQHCPDKLGACWGCALEYDKQRVWPCPEVQPIIALYEEGPNK